MIPFITTDGNAGYLGVMDCPICGHENTHIDGFAVLDGSWTYVSLSSDQEVVKGSAEDCLELSMPCSDSGGTDFVRTKVKMADLDGKTRQGCVILFGWCEGCDTFALRFAEHKGCVYPSAFRIQPTEPVYTGKVAAHNA